MAAKVSRDLSKLKGVKAAARKLEKAEERKLSAIGELVDAINEARAANVPVRRIASDAGISVQHLYNLVEGRTRGGRPGRLRQP